MQLTIGTNNISFLYQASLPFHHVCAKSEILSDHFVQGMRAWTHGGIFSKSQITQLK